MKKKHIYTAVILLLFLAVGIQPAHATIYLRPTGWEDENGPNPELGTWNSTTQIAVLMQDVFETIKIEISGEINQDVILDGNGHKVELNSYGSTDYGVALAGRLYVTVQNLNVTKCNSGIALNPSGYCNVIDCTISYCSYAGIFMSNAGTITIEGNHISNNVWGILMQAPNNSLNNTLKNNTIEENNVGLEIGQGVHDNQVYNNNFINNITQAAVQPMFQSNNSFNLSKEDGGGNYWSNWCPPEYPDEVPEGGDGIVDSPYTIVDDPDPDYLVQDNFPWVVKNGWIEPAVLIGQLVTTVTDMNLQQGIDNSLDAKLDAAFNALDDVNQNNDVAAINSLYAFINAVEAQRGSKITDEQADTLVSDATDIITLLGG